uniref:Uncharacterized protein n=1 Tax=uncultured prokaryote TaxID=198431 RepID=A0A0H5Q1M5_9ZZZZ|nr:hypothetical protein [uncultured prokaryote]
MARRRHEHRRRVHHRSFRHHRRASTTHAIIPLALGGGAAAALLLGAAPNGDSLLNRIQVALSGDVASAANGIGPVIAGQMANNAITAVELGAGAIVASWAGKHFLRRTTKITKKWSLF